MNNKAEGDKDLHPDFAGNYNLSDDLGIPSVNNSEPLIMNELPDDEYRHIVQTLNKEQKEFFYHVLHLIKTSEEPFYCFLSGGAGVGKSHVTKALYQAALKYYTSHRISPSRVTSKIRRLGSSVRVFPIWRLVANSVGKQGFTGD